MKILGFVGIMLFWTASATAQSCEIPPNFHNQTSVTENGLWVGFATDTTVYSGTGTVQFFLVVKNVGTETFYLNWLMDPQDGFFVLPDSCPSIDWPGCLNSPPFYFPQIVFMYSSGTRLEPGQCRAWVEEWEMPTSYWWTPQDGTYNVFGGMCIVGFTATTIYADFQVPSDGAMLTITIDTGVPVQDTTWGGVKAMYSD